MSYFSRLSDIVTCNLTTLLDGAANPSEALERIVFEMSEGMAGADRSVNTALNAESQLARDLEEQLRMIRQWTDQARQHLSHGEEEQARQAIQRKQEVEALVAGLQQQHQAAISTREHLETTRKALQARLAEARRRLQEMKSGPQGVPALPPGSSVARSPQIEQELEALRRELEHGV